MAASYWPEPGPLTPAYWDDPCPAWQGMLSSDLIGFYNDEVGGMIGPWEDERLKPASYELTLGPNCLVNGEIRVLSDDDPWLEIPYNSIVFVSMGQWVRLPHYLAARFDLAIEFIYQGILLGTGPQVDPGFQGVLSCPLHNISSDSVHMRLGQPFAKIDFAKTSGLRKANDEGVLRKMKDEPDLYSASVGGHLPGSGDHPVKLFKSEKRWREPIFAPGYAGQKLVRSSVKRLEDEVVKSRTQIEEFGDDVRRIRRFGIASAVGIVLAIASLLLALAQLDRSYTDAQVNQAAEKTKATSSAQNAAVDALIPRMTKSERELARLRVQLAELRARLQARLGSP
jgi:deoxycytidine triphosphate deaminase